MESILRTDTVTLREHVEAQIDALAILMASKFDASEKAIIKAENAQTEYNIRSNEFRGQLDDQAKMLMPRAETNVMLKGLEDKLYSSMSSLDRQIATNANEIAALREYRASTGGKSAGSTAMWGYVVGAVGFLLSLMSLFTLMTRVVH